MASLVETGARKTIYPPVYGKTNVSHHNPNEHQKLSNFKVTQANPTHDS